MSLISVANDDAMCVLVQKKLGEIRKDAEKDHVPKIMGGRGGGGGQRDTLRNDLLIRGSRNAQGGGFRGRDGKACSFLVWVIYTC